MICPKCAHENPPEQEDCSRCGVIFARIPQGLAPKVPGPGPFDSHAPPNPHRATVTDLLFPIRENESGWHLGGLALALLVMVLWGGKLVFSGIAGNAAGESWLHLINLPFHEAGHVIFRPLGSFLASLGGTLGQLLIPLVCM